MISYIDAHKILRFRSERKTSISPIKSQLKTYFTAGRHSTSVLTIQKYHCESENEKQCSYLYIILKQIKE